MLTPQLKILKMKLEGRDNVHIDKKALLVELNKLETNENSLQESLSLSTKVCPTCGRRL